jgi:hypothetical protein
MNPFMIAMGIANFAAGGWYLAHDNPRMAVVVFCYGVASFALSTLK